MKNETSMIKLLIIAILLVVFVIPCRAQIECLMCYSSKNVQQPCNSTWDDYYGGVSYS